MLCSRKNEDLISACLELRAKGIDAQWLSGDCASEKDILSLAEQSVSCLGGQVDILVNNAGWFAAKADRPSYAYACILLSFCRKNI